MRSLCTILGQCVVSVAAETAGRSLFQLPIVDVGPWMSETNFYGESFVHDGVVQQLDDAFSEYGFAVVIGHGVKSELFDRVYDAAKQFFRSEEHVKQQYNLGLGYGYGGYLGTGSEAGGQLTGEANEEGKADVVESLTCRGLQHINLQLPDHHAAPHFAQDMSDVLSADRVPPGLLEPTMELHNAMFPFKTLLTRATERVLGVERGAFQQAFDPRRGGIRFPYYPELQNFSAEEHPIGYGAHSDSGGMVILRVDRENPVGTEVFYRDQWLPVPTDVPNAIVLNGGTVLQRLMGGRWKAAVHRAARANKQERLSIVYGAMVPHNDLEVSSLAVAELGTTAIPDLSREHVVRVKEYLDARVRMQRPETDPRDKELVVFVDQM